MTPSPQHSPDFRPNPDRAVFLSETISQATLDRLTPKILRLQSANRTPISLYIDSNGGSVSTASTLHKLLSSVDQDGNPPCRLITVVTGTAASAAADLLMAGDYALAYQHTQILCHGVRQGSEMLTQEKATNLAKDLASSNEQFAIRLADNCISRFIFRVAVLSSEFPEIRQRLQNPIIAPTGCFIEALTDRISVRLIHVLKGALSRSVDNEALDAFASQALVGGPNVASLSRAQLQALLLKLILDYELKQHEEDEDWAFLKDGLGRIEDKLVLLFDLYDRHHSEMISQLCRRWGATFLSSDQSFEVSELPEQERSGRIESLSEDTIRKLWFFFVSVCRSLQKDDYWMSAEEAYWLGLIDEVIGRTDLPSIRLIVEYSPPEDETASA